MFIRSGCRGSGNVKGPLIMHRSIENKMCVGKVSSGKLQLAELPIASLWSSQDVKRYLDYAEGCGHTTNKELTGRKGKSEHQAL